MASFIVLIFPLTASAEFVKKGGYTYYLDKNGNMLTGAYIIGGSHYRFRDDGRMYIGWVRLEGGNYNYFLQDGKRASGFTKIGSAFYYFLTDGTMLRSGGFLIDNKIYTFASDGKVIKITGSSCLSGHFEESFYELKSRKPSVISIGGEKTLSYAKDLIPVGLTGTDAVGTDFYLFTEGKLAGGLRSFSGTSKTAPASVLSDEFNSLKKLTEDEAETIFDKLHSECEKKYGKENKDDELLKTIEDYIDGSGKMAVFANKYTVAVVAIKDGTVSELILDKQIISTIN
ncbi:MAG: hypothetical protein LBL98_02495 [Ruminococcus sp.]|nr:hypothetical protein [Ruminococcus sp.]